MSDFDRGFAAAESDVKTGWFSLDWWFSNDWPDSYIRNACVMNGGESDEFADGYLAFVNSRPSF